jgi:hypothetical protein
MLTTDHDAPRPYPRLSEAQKARVLSEVAMYFTLLDNIQVIQNSPRTIGGAQLELF